MRGEMKSSPLLDPVARSPVIRLVAVGFVLLFVALRWDSTTGFTGLIRFGEKFTEQRLPALRPLPIAPSRGDGYDGQFYAQIAVEPSAANPDLARALDKPSYRPRRILLPLLAHLLGGGDPWLILQVYALLNTAAWLVLAFVCWRLIPLGDWRATAAWCGIVLGVGALDSVRLSLTDLPAALLLTLAAVAVERAKPVCAAVWCLLAGLTREVSLLGALLIRTRSRWRTFWLRAACAAPVLAWCAWLAWRLPGPVGHEGNIEWPGVAFARELGANVARVALQGYDSQWAFGVLGGLGLAAQSIYVLRQWRSFTSSPWVSIGLPFAVLFWFIGTDPWHDYRAVARDCLPMTIVFNVLLVRRASAHPLWFLANVAVIDGVIRMTPP